MDNAQWLETLVVKGIPIHDAKVTVSADWQVLKNPKGTFMLPQPGGRYFQFEQDGKRTFGKITSIVSTFFGVKTHYSIHAEFFDESSQIVTYGTVKYDDWINAVPAPQLGESAFLQSLTPTQREVRKLFTGADGLVREFNPKNLDDDQKEVQTLPHLIPVLQAYERYQLQPSPKSGPNTVELGRTTTGIADTPYLGYDHGEYSAYEYGYFPFDAQRFQLLAINQLIYG